MSSERLYHLSKETKMKRKRKAFVKVFKKLSWFLLISGLGLILACQSWSQIRVPGLRRDTCLEKFMEKLGFVEKWRDLLMKCVTSITYSMKINGKPRWHIVPSRGLRQGDPLSPYLFLLCTEGLSAPIKSAIANGQMGGLAVHWNGPKLSHLFSANDSLIFCKATMEECNALQQILQVYKNASGQQLNWEKPDLELKWLNSTKIFGSSVFGMEEEKEYL